ncbi:hypothetical protein KO527_02725 [Pseudoalteromonas sp. C2R02]|uniref:hypothetical protein n=1 Tax=Pseudoalteromonas sp. C2R02 TaxID=2841565 RepID=UPI001C083F61|nr:hypothetical protein [Pseudoalteromonas sp. C2R02]MBU2968270.1 hypothetical protein [Pseudoalteromonas sp. C2R02]
MTQSQNKSAYKLDNKFNWRNVIKMQPEFGLISAIAKSKPLILMVVVGLALYTAFAVFLFKMASI